MGPTNVALVKLYKADHRLREAQGRLEAASRDVRVQERRVNELAERHKLASSQLMEARSAAAQVDLDLKTRDAHIEKLRDQQQNAKNNKEYQAFLIEINTEKLDKGKIEEQLLKLMEDVETGQAETAELATQLEAEQTKLSGIRSQIEGRLAILQAEIDALRPARDEAYEVVPPAARELFERLADRHEGEGLSALAKPDPRREEYICGACNMDLVVDVYNKLHTRDELVFCPSCRRILYIPEDLPPETAVNKKKPSKPKKVPELGARARRGESAVDVLNSTIPEAEEAAPAEESPTDAASTSPENADASR